MARKHPSFGQLVAYMEKDASDRVLYHNFYGHDRMRSEEIVREFRRNADNLSRRKNGNALYHEILSLKPGKAIDRETARRVMSDIGSEYLRRRASDQLAFGVVHRDTDHVHLHLCISSNGVGRCERERLSKREFSEIQKELESLVIERYPELGQTRVYDKSSSKEKVKTTSREQAAKTRTAGESRKETLARKIHAMLEMARSKEELDRAFEREGLKLYVRGKGFGVVDRDGKKHRFSTLGTDLHFSAAVERFSAPKDAPEKEFRYEAHQPAEERVVREKTPEYSRKEELERARAAAKGRDGPERDRER